jgi:hypothetical protein
MKKALFAILMIVAVAFAGAPKAEAQSLSLNFGTVTDSSLSFKPFLWLAGATIDIPLGPILSLCPEGSIVVHDFDFGAFFFAPAVMLNVNAAGLYVGAGVTKLFLVGSEVSGAPSSDFSLKLNAGFQGSSLRLNVFLITSFKDAFKSSAVGATLGFVL